jgi:hypothetical protein
MVAPRGRDSHPVEPPRSTSPRTSLLAPLLESLQDHVSSTGIVGVAEAALGVLGFAGLISSLFGEPAIKAGAIVATLVAILGLLVLLTASRSRLQSRNHTLEALLQHYCAALETRYHHLPRTKSWRQVITIDRQGNTTEQISCTIVADSEFVDYFSIWCGTGWTWPVHLQKKVRYCLTTARNGHEGGVRPTVTDSWYDRDRLAIIVHLSQPMSKGSEASFDLTIRWPLKCAPLIRRGEPEEFARTFPRPLDSLYYAVDLPSGYHQARFDTIGLKGGTTKYRTRQTSTKEGGRRITLTAEKVAAGQRVGMRIDPA